MAHKPKYFVGRSCKVRCARSNNKTVGRKINLTIFNIVVCFYFCIFEFLIDSLNAQQQRFDLFTTAF